MRRPARLHHERGRAEASSPRAARASRRSPRRRPSLEDPNLKLVADGLAASSFVQLWLDTEYGTTVGNAMNEGIVNLFGGVGTPEDIVKKMEDAAATL